MLSLSKHEDRITPLSFPASTSGGECGGRGPRSERLRDAAPGSPSLGAGRASPGMTAGHGPRSFDLAPRNPHHGQGGPKKEPDGERVKGMKRSFVMFVIIAMIGGFIAGMIVHGVASPAG